jgi:hypothetical protein
MAPNKQTKKAPTQTFKDLFPSDWSADDDDLDYPYNTQHDDSDLFSDKDSIVSGDDQVVAEGIARGSDASSSKDSNKEEAANENESANEMGGNEAHVK